MTWPGRDADGVGDGAQEAGQRRQVEIAQDADLAPSRLKLGPAGQLPPGDQPCGEAARGIEHAERGNERRQPEADRDDGIQRARECAASSAIATAVSGSAPSTFRK